VKQGKGTGGKKGTSLYKKGPGYLSSQVGHTKETKSGGGESRSHYNQRTRKAARRKSGCIAGGRSVLLRESVTVKGRPRAADRVVPSGTPLITENKRREMASPGISNLR